MDPKVESVATSWFGVPRWKRMKYIVEGGTSYLREAFANGKCNLKIGKKKNNKKRALEIASC